VALHNINTLTREILRYFGITPGKALTPIRAASCLHSLGHLPVGRGRAVQYECRKSWEGSQSAEPWIFLPENFAHNSRASPDFRLLSAKVRCLSH
jgi:hypothetical protein